MARGHSIYHYATRADYEPVIADVANEITVKYTVDEWRVVPDHRVYQSPLDALDFGVSDAPQYAGLTAFFILPEDADLPFSYMSNRVVPEKYGFVPSADLWKRWVIFRSSGLHKSEQWGEGLLEGWLSTNSEHPDSLAIFNAFKSSIKKRFEYLKGYGAYVGKEAAEYMDKGGRLTQDLRSPVIGDCKRMPVSA